MRTNVWVIENGIGKKFANRTGQDVNMQKGKNEEGKEGTKGEKGRGRKGC